MRKVWLLSLALIGFGLLPLSIEREVPAVPAPRREKDIKYETHTLQQSVVHTLFIPAQSRFVVTPALSEQLDTLESFAHKHRAIAALNGGFFDPKNHKTTSHVVLQGKQVADPRQNERLMNNPDMLPYMDKILNRTEFRRYICGQAIRYDIALHQELPPAGCQLLDALGAGPGLLPEMTSLPEGFLDVANGEVIKDALGSSRPNARSAVGITRDGSIVLVMVAQKPKSAIASGTGASAIAQGMSLPELAAFMKTLGVEKAMNLDGGSSSSLYYKGKTFYGKVDKAGNQVRRPIKSVLLVQLRHPTLLRPERASLR